MNTRTAFLGAALALAAALPVFAQDTGHSGHQMAASASDSPSTQAYIDANTTMHKGMDIVFSGDADVDFVRGMIAHHQGAIDMAKVELDYGKDPAIRKLAEDIIAAQEGEIKMMKEWLAKNAK